MKKLLSVFILCIIYKQGIAQCAQFLGEDDRNQASYNKVYYTSIAIDKNNVTYISFKDFGQNGKSTVMKYNNNAWSIVGNAGFSDGEVAYTKIIIDTSGTPYVAFQDFAHNKKATVMKYDGTSWTSVGMPGFTSATTYPDLDIDSTGTPYVAFTDSSNGYKATVMKYDGTNWTTVGAAGFSTGESWSVNLAIGSNEKLFVSYFDVQHASKACAMTFDGTSWNSLGPATGFSSGQAGLLQMTTDFNGTPYVIFKDYTTSNKGTVMKFNGTAWTTIGSQGFTTTYLNGSNSISVAPDGSPVVLYVEAYSNNAILMKFDGAQWVMLGNSIPSSYSLPSMVLDNLGTPHVVLDEYSTGKIAKVVRLVSNTWQQLGSRGLGATSIKTPVIRCSPDDTLYAAYGFPVEVKKFNGTTWVPVGNTISNSFCQWVDLAIDKNGIPYIAYGDESNSGRAIVKKFNGTSWITVGQIWFSASQTIDIDIDIDNSGTPYVGYWTSSFGATVMKYNGSIWVNVGSPGFSGTDIDFFDMTLDGAGNPYVAYTDYLRQGHVTVMMYNGSYWDYLGYGGVSPGNSSDCSIAFDYKNNIPYVAYKDLYYGRKAVVVQYKNGSWNLVVGNNGLLTAEVWETKIAIDPVGTPYLLFSDLAQNKKLSMLRFIQNNWETVDAGFSSGEVSSVDLAINNQGIPYALYSSYGVFAFEMACVDSVDLRVPTTTISTNTESSTKIYPNPGNGQYTIHTEEETYATVFDSFGNKVNQYSFSKGEQLLDLSEYPNGIYMVKLIAPRESSTLKIIKQ